MVIGPSFILKGFEPAGVRKASAQERRLFWQAVAAYVVELKAAELEAGLDRNGEELVALKPRTIKYRRSAMGPADPNAPPLQPAHGLSRTRSLFTVEVSPSANGLVCFWAFDSRTGASWGEILDHHRKGSGALPIRDVFGLSPQSMARLKQRASDWWRGYELGLGVNIQPTPIPMPSPIGGGGGPPGWKPRGSGWGRVTGLPGVGQRTRNEIERRRVSRGNHHYDLQGGLGLIQARDLPPSPPAGTPHPLIPRPPVLPSAAVIRQRAQRTR